MSNERDHALIKLLNHRDGVLTVGVFEDGTETVIANIAWGYDRGEAFAHVTTNISPAVEGLESEFFITSDLVALLDHATRRPLFRFPI